MGLLPFQSGNRKYSMELEYHLARTPTELPVEKLDAIFIESSDLHPNNSSEIQRNLNKLDQFWQNKRVKEGAANRVTEIIQRARESGTELWLGDVRLTNIENVLNSLYGPAFILAGGALGEGANRALHVKPSRRTFLRIAGLAAGATLTVGPGFWLSRKGDASRRTISKAITKTTASVNPGVTARNIIMAHKIQALAEKTGHHNIGINIGGGHVGMEDLLKQNIQLTPEARAEIAKRGPDALKMYRCIYNKRESKWQVEEHSL
ncbi:MAG: hypothetical protein V1722_05775 [Candidatus Micrarchaeota archaeon]